MMPPQDGTVRHGTCGHRRRSGHRRLLIQTLMRSAGVVVGDEFGQNTLQIGVTEDQDVVEALCAGCSYPSFGV